MVPSVSTIVQRSHFGSAPDACFPQEGQVTKTPPMIERSDRSRTEAVHACEQLRQTASALSN